MLGALQPIVAVRIEMRSMNDQGNNKTPASPVETDVTTQRPEVAAKSFLSVGPTLHYSHSNVMRCWLLALGAFILTCLFWSKIVSGAFWSFDLEIVGSWEYWRLGRSLVTGVSIFEYPWQIIVLGLLMGILAVAPPLISQLMSFGHSIPFLLAVFFFANLPGFALCLLVSCFGAACRPLRFRSRFIAIALCIGPQLLYWGYMGGARGVEPLEWGFSFAPWICAWIDSLLIASFVLGVGHFTRYRPGLVWISTFAVLVTAVVLFEVKIGFDELDYQLYVAKNNPEQISEFHEHSITEALDRTITDPELKKYLANIVFYPTEPIPLRAALKEEILIQLDFNRWPSWFTVPQHLDYIERQKNLLDKYEVFIKKRPNSKRMPIALYYKGLLGEYAPDIRYLEQAEVLRFYNDYPHRENLLTWHRLFEYFGQSPESIEARWRIAWDWAGQGKFEQADLLLEQAQSMIAARSAEPGKVQAPEESLFALFRPPEDSVMTRLKLIDLQRRINLLHTLISEENGIKKPPYAERLAKFVTLNPHSTDYSQHLTELRQQATDNDPLRDNIELAQAKLVVDEQRRADRLSELHKGFAQTDGGMLALYELGLLKIKLWRQMDAGTENRKQYLSETRATLTEFLNLYPNSFCAARVKKNLEGLPSPD